jgi:exosortase H (IPTLxxWG-CTERM-specific)
MAGRKPRPQHDKKRARTKRANSGRSALWKKVQSGHFRFAVAFTLSCIGLYSVVNALPQAFTKPINEQVARTLGLLLNAFSIPALTNGDIVSEKGLAFQIIPECTPIFTIGIFFSFVAFHPASLAQKAKGLLMGIPVLYMGNLFRLAATFMISRYDGRLFEVTHVYQGQVFTLLLVILCCVLWMSWVERERRSGV